MIKWLKKIKNHIAKASTGTFRFGKNTRTEKLKEDGARDAELEQFLHSIRTGLLAENAATQNPKQNNSTVFEHISSLNLFAFLLFLSDAVKIVELDEKCLTILEELNSRGNPQICSFALYSRTKPIQQKELARKLREMEKADLIFKNYESPSKFDDYKEYQITRFGIDVAEMLKEADERTLNVLHFMQGNNHGYFTPSDVAEKTGYVIDDVEIAFKKLVEDEKVDVIGSRGNEGLYMYIC